MFLGHFGLILVFGLLRMLFWVVQFCQLYINIIIEHHHLVTEISVMELPVSYLARVRVARDSKHAAKTCCTYIHTYIWPNASVLPLKYILLIQPTETQAEFPVAR